ncbi:MAG: zinc transporter [Gammaproteobacteria bacterium]|jgi:zinc transporter ZupT|nr:zinc transporter [Gammaproteobacteria bacterium]
MDLIHFKIVSALLIFVMTIVAGFVPFSKRLKSLQGHEFPIGEALACGVFLGAGLIHMLGDASQAFTSLGYHYPFAFLISGCCFLFLLLLEHIGTELNHHRQGNAPAIALLAVIMLSIHALLAGTALGLSRDLAGVFIILLAILAHKWAESFSLSVQINKTTLSIKSSLIIFFIFSIMTPLGIMLGSSIASMSSLHPLLEPIFSALAAGTFIYIGTLHGLSRSAMIQCCNLKHFSFLILGFVLMAVVAIWT